MFTLLENNLKLFYLFDIFGKNLKHLDPSKRMFWKNIFDLGLTNKRRIMLRKE